MMRTLQKFKKQKNSQNDKQKKDNTEIAPAAFPSPPGKGRGKTYQNKSSLDNWDDSNMNNQQSPK